MLNKNTALEANSDFVSLSTDEMLSLTNPVIEALNCRRTPQHRPIVRALSRISVMAANDEPISLDAVRRETDVIMQHAGAIGIPQISHNVCRAVNHLLLGIYEARNAA